MAHILYFSEMDVYGSGYTNITINLCAGLAKHGHKVTILANNYQRQEHNFPFSVISISDARGAVTAAHNLIQIGEMNPNYPKPDIFISALDIPWHEQFLRLMQQVNLPYVGIMPVESGPLCFSWAMALAQMTKVYSISQHGADEINKAGIEAEHLQIGMDTAAWRMPTEEERKATRAALLGIENDDTFVIFTNADNQERKNLSAGMEIVAEFSKRTGYDFRYVLLTRENLNIGWRLRDYAKLLKINEKVMIYERGLDFKTIWSLYAASDAFLLPTKAEGLGFPIMEAMSTGVPVIATETGACIEHVRRGSGYLISGAYEFTDPFGNAKRKFIDVNEAADALIHCAENPQDQVIADARKYMESRTWDIPVEQLEYTIQEIMNGKKASA